MKAILSVILSLSLALPVHADDTTQAYWQWTQNQNQDAASIDICLEKIYGNDDLQVCAQAINDLTQAPLNSHRREVLVSLLQKMPETKRTFLQKGLLKGLFLTHPELDSETLPAKKSQPMVSTHEMKAWLKVLSAKTDLKTSYVSLNGQPLKLASHFQAPQGIYQWSLVTSNLEPVIVVGSWNDFSMQVGKLQTQAAEKNWLPQTNRNPAEHLGDLPLPQEDSGSSATTKSHTWVWVTLLAVGAGVAAAMAFKDKNVSVTMPGAH